MTYTYRFQATKYIISKRSRFGITGLSEKVVYMSQKYIHVEKQKLFANGCKPFFASRRTRGFLFQLHRVARRYIFQPKIPIWVNFGVSCNERS
jgi:hypothetical protein